MSNLWQKQLAGGMSGTVGSRQGQGQEAAQEHFPFLIFHSHFSFLIFHFDNSQEPKLRSSRFSSPCWSFLGGLASWQYKIEKWKPCLLLMLPTSCALGAIQDVAQSIFHFSFLILIKAQSHTSSTRFSSQCWLFLAVLCGLASWRYQIEKWKGVPSCERISKRPNFVPT